MAKRAKQLLPRGVRRLMKSRHFSRRTGPGAVAGTVVADPEAPKPRLRVIGFGPGGHEEREITDPAEARALVGKWPVVWLDVAGLGDAGVIKQVGAAFGIHKLALEDVVNTHQRSKLEPYGENLFVIVREARPYDDSLETDQIGMFLGAGFVVTFCEKPGDAFEPVHGRIREHSSRLMTCGSDMLAYALIDAIVDEFFPVLEKLGERLAVLEDEAIENPTTATVARIHSVKRDLLMIRRAIWPARDMLNALVREPRPLIGDEARLFLRDCYDHAVQIIDMLESYREIASGLMETYLSAVSNRMNEVIKVLTMIATIFMPLSFIAGVYGMNFKTENSRLNMPELSWAFGYPFALFLMALTAGTMLLFFRSRGWILQGRKAGGGTDYRASDEGSSADGGGANRPGA